MHVLVRDYVCINLKYQYYISDFSPKVLVITVANELFKLLLSYSVTFCAEPFSNIQDSY